MPITVLVISHDPRVAAAVRSAIQLENSLYLIGWAENLRDAASEWPLSKPDIVICDLETSNIPGSRDLLAEIRTSLPHARVLVLLDVIALEGTRMLLRAGVDGVLDVTSAPIDLAHTMLAVHTGKSVIPFHILSHFFNA
jgi:DNA-binding NarL/FixJ family response regulator